MEIENKKENNSVLMDWVISLSWKEQTGLISAIRGYDNSENIKNTDNAIFLKELTKMIRFLVLNNADKNTSFMTEEIIPIEKIREMLLSDAMTKDIIDIHWLGHIKMASRIIYRKHPSNYTRYFYKRVYDIVVECIKNKSSEYNAIEDEVEEK